MEEIRYALDAIDTAERAVFSLKLATISERDKAYYKKRIALDKVLPDIADIHSRFQELVDKMMDISDALAPFYAPIEEGGDR